MFRFVGLDCSLVLRSHEGVDSLGVGLPLFLVQHSSKLVSFIALTLAERDISVIRSNNGLLLLS